MPIKQNEKEAAEQGRIGMMPPRPEPRSTLASNKDNSTAPKPKSPGPKPAGICDAHEMLNCPICHKKSGNKGHDDVSDDNDENFDEQQNPELTKTPRLVFEIKELTEEELKELQKNNPNSIFCQALVPLQTIAKQFQLFVNTLAQQQGLTYKQFMDQNPGFQCQQYGNVLEITMPNHEMMYNFLNQLNQNNMIKMPENVLQKINDIHQQQQTENSSASPFNPSPFSTRPTPPGYDGS